MFGCSLGCLVITNIFKGLRVNHSNGPWCAETGPWSDTWHKQIGALAIPFIWTQVRCRAKTWYQEQGWWYTILTQDMGKGYFRNGWLLTKNDGNIDQTKRREDQRWSWLKLRPIMYLQTVWWHCWNGNQYNTCERFTFGRYKDAYCNGKIYKAESVSVNRGFRLWMPSRRSDCWMSWLIIYVRLPRCFGITSTCAWSTAQVPHICFSHPYTIYLPLLDISRIPKRATCVRQSETSLFLATYGKWCTYRTEILSPTVLGYISNKG